jgi:Protein of unknown function (DUF4232)
MPPTATDDELDAGLRDLFQSFETPPVHLDASRASTARRRLTFVGAFGWAAVMAVLIVVALTATFVYAHRQATATPTVSPTSTPKVPRNTTPSRQPHFSPSLFVLPDADLRNGEQVSVLMGFGAYAPFWVSECATIQDAGIHGCGLPSTWAYGSTNSSGEASTPFGVTDLASPLYPSTSVQICTDQCVIVVTNGTNEFTTAPLTFAAQPQEPPPTSSTPQKGSCSNSQLAISFDGPVAGLGHEGVTLNFKNTSATTCSVYGYPGVAGLDSAGTQVVQAIRTLSGYLGGVVTTDPSPPNVVLEPGQFASAIVEGTDTPVGPETSCPSYPKLLVTAPNTSRSVPLNVGLPACSGLEIHPVVPGTTGWLPAQ